MTKTTVAIIAQGAMGAGTAARLTSNGVDVVTWLEGRSSASRARAEKAGMRGVDLAGIAAADIILSIVPPSDALALAEQLAPTLKASKNKPLYADMNAVSSAKVEQVAAVIAPTGCTFSDGGIIGPPPRPDTRNTIYFFSAIPADRVAPLAKGGLEVKMVNGPIGAASALKMSYAAIGKGLTALASASILMADKYGAKEALLEELQRSQPNILKGVSWSVPDMFVKAYRFVGEMEEIAEQSGRKSTAAIYNGIADLYREIAADQDGPKKDVTTLEQFFKK
ncbi:NAD(P)-dependent oxidoreductase [Hyphomicrobium sp. CS1BSMeth3]|uniref:NAD(P)-dependent oxidoreductase n=1 Tax=Hyphomicrobium sp. CS1BSMeth3 TaxID=1892844 RepID=UPI000930763B|nr:NAD(P)-dependent oxidoreductase [Hyphomicrobium sp. CS1BSMeth3]